MSIIRRLYDRDPGFPATDQHPDAVRYPIEVGVFRFVDAVGGEPTLEEIEAVLAPPTPVRTKDDILADIAALTAEVQAMP